MVEHDDRPTIDAARELDVEIIVNEGPGSYASCINTAYARTDAPFLFMGADDIRFGPGALDVGLERMQDETVGVVGAFDPLHPKADHSDHYMVRRQYIDVHGGSMDRPGRVLFPYQHGFTDVELVCVAKVRGSFCFCPEFVVYHDHPGWVYRAAVDESSPLFDEVYQKGNDAFPEDLQTFAQRSRPWRRQLLARPGATDADRFFVHLARMNDTRTRRAYGAKLLAEIDPDRLKRAAAQERPGDGRRPDLVVP